MSKEPLQLPSPPAAAASRAEARAVSRAGLFNLWCSGFPFFTTPFVRKGLLALVLGVQFHPASQPQSPSHPTCISHRGLEPEQEDDWGSVGA